MRCQDGDTALHFAVQSGHAAVARVLITHHNAKTTIKNGAGLNKFEIEYIMFSISPQSARRSPCV